MVWVYKQKLSTELDRITLMMEMELVSETEFINHLTWLSAREHYNEKWYTLIRKSVSFISKFTQYYFKKCTNLSHGLVPLEILASSVLFTNVLNVSFFHFSAISCSLHFKPELALVLKTIFQFSCKKMKSSSIFLVCSIISQYQFASSF
jgi:hypothetical protein